MTSSASPEQCILTCWHTSPEYKGELWHTFLMLSFRTPKMSITFNSMAVVVTGQHNNRRIWKTFHLLIRESQGLGLCGMELILCRFKGLKAFKLIAVGDENSPREASETDVTWLADKACGCYRSVLSTRSFTKIHLYTCRFRSYHMGNRERFVE